MTDQPSDLSSALPQDTPDVFAPAFESLPETLPIFPLPGIVLLPRGRLPLNIFEPRYLAMIEDAMGQGRLIGMIQPSSTSEPGGMPPVYAVGCAGRITTFTETEDGRFLITLIGVCRFQVQSEIPLGRGYRRVKPNWLPFRGDLEPEGNGTIDRPRMFAILRGYFRAQGIAANWEAIEQTPDERLITSLAMICPFAPNEKQALLEAKTLSERGKLLTALIEMAQLSENPQELPRH